MLHQNSTTRKRFLFKHSLSVILICYFVLFAPDDAKSQVTIDGATCVIPGTEYQYTINGTWYPYHSMSWCVTGGTIVDHPTNCKSGMPLPYIRVIWNSGTIIRQVELNSSIGNASINVNASSNIVAGNISANQTQTKLNYETPAAISCAAPAGGACVPDYEYQWEYSINAVNWDFLPENLGTTTSATLTFNSSLTQTIYVRRRVTDIVSSSTSTSNNATITVLEPISISGKTNCVLPGVTYTYDAGGSWVTNSNFNWCITNGQIVGNGSTLCKSALNLKTIQVIWAGSAASIDVTVTSFPQVGRTVTPLSTNQINISFPVSDIYVNTTPSTPISSQTAINECGTHAYKWEYYDGATWYDAGVSTENYVFAAPLSSNTSYRRKILVEGTVVATSNVIHINVYNLLNGGVIQGPAPVVYGNPAGAITSTTAASGGLCGTSYAYSWEKASDAEFTSPTSISSNTVGLTSPGVISAPTYFRRLVTCNGETIASNIILISSDPPIVPGTISAASQNIAYNADAATMTLSGVSGGNGVYSRQWQKSTGSIFTNISGAINVSYKPLDVTATTQYRVAVTSNGITVYSSIAVVNVGMIGGTISTSNSNIKFGTSCGLITSTVDAAGSSCSTYLYQWQSSIDNINYYNVSGSNASYTPGPLASTTYFRRKAKCGTDSAVSNTLTITVESQLIAGVATPAYYKVASGTSPGRITANPARGGNCSGSYAYLWQKSINSGASWTNLATTTTVLNPGNHTVNTWYRLRVVCGTDTEYSNISRIIVGAISADQNFVRSREIIKSLVTDTTAAKNLAVAGEVKQVTQYFDGLGRPIQSVTRRGTPLQKDWIMQNMYDDFGREIVQYMPFASTSNSGVFHSNPLSASYNFNSGINYYSGEDFYYQQSNFEPSPLNRVSSSAAQGKNWVGSNREVVQQYLMNAVSDSVRIWNVSFTLRAIPTHYGIYPVGRLQKTITTDEQDQVTVEFKDKQGNIILKKVQVAASPATGHTGWLCTYYIYDDLGQLRCVIQPKGVEAIKATWTITDAICKELCFRYDYDARGRLIIKKVPGGGEEKLVYDSRDRLIMTQDSLQKAGGKWLYTQYDHLNRPYLTGSWTNASTQAVHQAKGDTSIIYPSPTTSQDTLTHTYYDYYIFPTSNGSGLDSILVTTYINSTNFVTNYTAAPYAMQITPHYLVRNKPTGTKVRILGSSAKYLYTLTLYDAGQRPIQIRSTNISGGTDIVTSQYSFDGKLLRSHLQHQKAGYNTQNYQLATRYAYDHMGRDTAQIQNFNGTGLKTISRKAYDETSLLDNKELGNGLENLDYTYNVRSWLTSINKDYLQSGTSYFGMELAYDNATSIQSGNTYLQGLYNGNITGTTWKSRGDNVSRKYDFTYDRVSRLTGAGFLQNSGGGWNNTNIDFTVSNLTYDPNGNIMSMNQKGLKLNNSSLIDQLTYSYTTNTNRLRKVDEAIVDADSKLGDFKDGPNTGTDDYFYDQNGNLARDKNKLMETSVGGNGITYNYLNLPSQILVKDKGSISYIYDATGNKLRKIITEGAKIDTTTYIDAFVYKDDTLQFVSHEEGRLRPDTLKPNPYKFHYDYFIKDHLGNVRMVLTDEQDTMRYVATMEDDIRVTEQQFFGPDPLSNIEAARPGGFDIAGSKVMRLNYNDAGRKTGASILLKVMATDTVTLGVETYYQSSGQNNSNSSVAADMITALIGSFGGSASGALDVAGKFTVGERNLTTFTAGTYPGITGLKNDDPNADANKPKAYLNWILFDEQFNMDASSSGTRQVGSAADFKGVLAQGNIVMGKNGYLYVYVSNESPMNVYFDNLAIEYKRGRISEETHYYPFGLAMTGISSKALRSNYHENKRKYNDAELNTTFDINNYEFFYRTYDPQIGRWHGLDKKPSDMVSLYAAMSNNPIRYSDPLGDTVAVFRPDGSFWKFQDDGKKEWSGMFYQKSTVKSTFERDGVQYEEREYSDGKAFQFNDPSVDVQAIKNERITRIEILSNAQVEGLIEKSGVKSAEAQANPLSFANKQGRQGNMDYGIKGLNAGVLKKNTFYIRENSAYNVGDIGNYLWGRGMAELGINLGNASIGAHINNMANGKKDKTPSYDFGPGTYGKPGLFDSESDQRAIHNGYRNSPKGAMLIKQELKNWPKNAPK